jgi:PAS domain S-box-containing protein
MVRQTGQKSGRAKPAGSDEVIRQVMAERHTRSSRKLSEKKLRESEDKFRTVFMDSPYGLTLSTLSEGRLLDVNPSFANLSGYSIDELTGKTTKEVGLWTDKADRAKLLSMFKKSGQASMEVILRRKSGEQISCIISARTTLLLDNTECLICVVQDITERKQIEMDLIKSQLDLRNLAMSLEMARENEKKIISREIHDELGQLMTGLKMDIAWVSGRLGTEQKMLKNKTQSMLEMVDEAIRSVKRITTQLRPRILDEMGLAAAVEWQAERFEKQSGIKCKTSFWPADIDVAMEISIVMFRVLQEALTNVARHSHATAAAINLKAVDRRLVLQVKDNGVGITPARLNNQHSNGLMGIRERLLAIGGDLQVKGLKGRGTALTASVTLAGQGG